MPSDRITRVNELLRREISECVLRLLTVHGGDAASVMVSRVSASRNLRSAKVWISILGDPEQQHEGMSMVRRFRREIQESINRDLSLKYTPRLNFCLDDSIAQGDSVLSILTELGDDESSPIR
jgi:ribosome-binding factor A